jgi:glutamate synthase domain-containing protein 3
MTGGDAFILDASEEFPENLNHQLVEANRLTDEADFAKLEDLVARHRERTGSARAKEILDDWGTFRGRFWKVSPKVPDAPVIPASKDPQDEDKMTISEQIAASR